MIKESFGDRAVRFISTLIMLFFAVLALLPLVQTLALSFSSRYAAEMNAVTFWPVQFTTASWRKLFENGTIWRSFFLSAISTVIVVVASVILTALMAYPLSKSYFKAGKFIMLIMVFTMVFNAPTVPYFLTLKSYGLYNNPWALVLPHLFSAYNMAIMRTNFKAFPQEIEEAAVIDGCGTWQVLFKIVLPSSKASIATIALFYGVAAWNQYRNPMMFITDTKWYPLQMKVRQLINSGTEISSMHINLKDNFNADTIGAATIIFAIIPVIAIYPLLQKHFAKGAMLGSVKG